jgi:hypothetical protein
VPPSEHLQQDTCARLSYSITSPAVASNLSGMVSSEYLGGLEMPSRRGCYHAPPLTDAHVPISSVRVFTGEFRSQRSSDGRSCSIGSGCSGRGGTAPHPPRRHSSSSFPASSNCPSGQTVDGLAPNSWDRASSTYHPHRAVTVSGKTVPSPAHVAEVILCDMCGMALFGRSLASG